MFTYWKSDRAVKLYFTVIVALQLIVIVATSKYIFNIINNGKVLGSASPNLYSDSGILESPDSEFEHYYKLNPEHLITEIRFWDQSKALITINRDGLNERNNYSILKADNTFRILTLGDSFTYGQFIDTNNNWTERLEDMLNDKSICQSPFTYEVINLGVKGFDIPYIIKRFKEIGLKYNPNLILWLESGSGLYRDREKMDPLIKNCVDNAKQESNRDWVTVQEYSRCWGEAQDTIINKTPKEDIEKRVLNLTDYFLKVKGITPLVIASFPSIDKAHEKILSSLSETYPDFYFTKDISEISFENGTALSALDGHPNNDGHTLISKDMFNYITSNKELGVYCNSPLQ